MTYNDLFKLYNIGAATEEIPDYVLEGMHLLLGQWQYGLNCKMEREADFYREYLYLLDGNNPHFQEYIKRGNLFDKFNKAVKDLQDHPKTKPPFNEAWGAYRSIADHPWKYDNGSYLKAPKATITKMENFLIIYNRITGKEN